MKRKYIVRGSNSKRICASKRLGGRKVMAAQDYYTENLADFGMEEIEELYNILDAWLSSGLPDDFDSHGVRPAFNRISGSVFLVNDEYQVCMAVGGNLESWYYTPYSGHEGFYEDLIYDADDSWDTEDLEYLRDLAEMRGDSEGINKCNTLIENAE